MNKTQLSEKIYSVENKLSQINALFSDIYGEYFGKREYNINSEDETERLSAIYILASYPHLDKLFQLLFDTTLEAERMIKKIYDEI